jgi:PAS domain S-box-containing protein
MPKNAGRWAPGGWAPILVVLGALGAAFVVRYALHRFMGEHFRFIFFSIAALLVCAYAGIWHGLWVAIAGLVLGFYFFVQPYNSFTGIDAQDLSAIVVYLLTTSVTLFLVEWLQRSKYEVRILMLETKYKNKRLEEILDNLARAENSASINAERVDMLAATVPHIWSIRRSGGKTDYFNVSLYEITGMPPGSLDGEGWTKAMHPNDRALVQELSRHAEKTGARQEVSVRLRLADGAYHNFSVHCSRIEDKHGKVIVWSGPLTEDAAGMPITVRNETI